MNKVPFYKQKTFWSACGVIVGGIMQLFPTVFLPDVSSSVMVIFVGLTAIFMRQGVEKSK